MVSRRHHDHSPEAIAKRLSAGPRQVYLKDFVYGAVDGGVTTFAVVSGVAGSGLSSSVIIILGLANIVADGFSMAVSNFLGTRAENQRLEKERAEELAEIESHPEGEREEIRQIYARKGFTGKQLEEAVEVITADENLWVETMLQEEHGLSLQVPNATMAGLATFVAFAFVGLLPLIPFLVNWWYPETIAIPYLVSSVITLIAFFVIGAFKGQFVNHRWYWSGFETLLVGGAAALLAFGVGLLLGGVVP